MRIPAARNARFLLVITLATLYWRGLVIAQPLSQASPPASSQQQAAEAVPERVQVLSGVMGGLLIKRVNPKYPQKARQNYIQGTVVLTAKISKQGDITDLELVSGDPLLAKAAIAAVKQWKYRPYLLQGKPVEVETRVQVNFTLSGG